MLPVNSVGSPSQTPDVVVETPPAPLGRPQPPTLLAATATTLKLRLSLPEDLRGNAADNLQFYLESDIGKLGVVEFMSLSSDETITLSRLRPACPYHVRVSVCGHCGNSPLSAFACFSTKPSAPLAPRSLRRVALESEYNPLIFARIAWMEPACDNGMPVKSYRVELASRKDPNALQFALVGQTSNNSYLLSGLRPGFPYAVRVQAVNAVGVGSVSETFLFSAGAAIPDAVEMPLLLQHPTDRQTTIAWSEPTSNGSPIRGYVVVLQPGNRTYHLSNVRTLTMSRLTAETEYSVTVAACNTEGQGPFSEPLVFRTEEKMPGVPSIPVVEQPVIKDKLVTLHWSAFADPEYPIMR